MKLYVGLFAGALGIILVLAGGSGSASGLWATLFGKGVTPAPDPNPANQKQSLVPPGASGGTWIPANKAEPPGTVLGGILPGISTSSYQGSNTLTGQGMLA